MAQKFLFSTFLQLIIVLSIAMAVCVFNCDFVFNLKLRLFVVLDAVHLRDILEHLLAFLKFIYAIEISG